MVAAMLLLSMVTAQPVAGSRPATPAEFEVTCALVGRDGVRGRFVLAAGGSANDRRVAVHPEGTSRWLDQITAGSVREGNTFHFVSGGTPYRLSLTFDEVDGDALTGGADLEEDRGAPALNLRVAVGSCNGSAQAARIALPALPPAPEIRPESYQARPTRLSQGRVPSNCTIVLRNLSELRFTLDVAFDPAGIELGFAPVGGEVWPASEFTLRGASLAALTTHDSGPPGGFMTVFASAGAAPNSGASAQVQYELRAAPNMIESWIELRVPSGAPELHGAGHCGLIEEDQ